MLPIISFTRDFPNAKAPTRATDGSAAFDLFAAKVRREGSKFIVDTGLRTSFSSSYVLLLFNRSGLACKHGIGLANGVAVIDSDYRGTIQLIFHPRDIGVAENVLVEGVRCAQAILMPIPDVTWKEVETLDGTERGEGGFGSTGLVSDQLARA